MSRLLRKLSRPSRAEGSEKIQDHGNQHTGELCVVVVSSFSDSYIADMPPEILDIILRHLWDSQMPSHERMHLMTACPLVNRTWRAVYARISAEHVHIPSLPFLYYLCRIIRSRKSVIYGSGDLLPRRMTCYSDLTYGKVEFASRRAYLTLANLPDFRGFDVCFPNLTALDLRLRFRVGMFSPVGAYMNGKEVLRTCIRISMMHTQATRRAIEWRIFIESPKVRRADAARLCTSSCFRLLGKSIAPGPISADVETWRDFELSSNNRKVLFTKSTTFCDRPGDLRGVNYCLGRAAGVSLSRHSFQIVFGGNAADLFPLVSKPGFASIMHLLDPVYEQSRWDDILRDTPRPVRIFFSRRFHCWDLSFFEDSDHAVLIAATFLVTL